MEKVIVIKYGGHAFEDKESINVLVQNIKNFHKNNYGVIIVHGGTPMVNEKLAHYGIVADMVDGIRVTSKEVVKVVQEAILGNETIEIIKLLNKNDISALSLNGSDCNLLRCEKMVHENGIDYGWVGKVYHVNTHLLHLLLDNKIVPVISPIGVDDLGNCYNLNSDPLASAIAIQMSADYLFMVTNIDGVRKDVNDANSRIKVLTANDIKNLIEDKTIANAMITKTLACLDYAKNCKRPAYIVDANRLLTNLEINVDELSTKIIDESSDFEIRLATKNDALAIDKIVKTSFKDYQKNIKYSIGPLSENVDDIIKDIDNKFVFVGIKDSEIIASIRLTINGKLGRISRVCVAPSYYNKGYGSKMLNYVENYAAKKGITHIGLTTIEDVDNLNHFYKKNGYQTKFITYNRGYKKALMLKNITSEEDINIDWYLM